LLISSAPFRLFCSVSWSQAALVSCSDLLQVLHIGLLGADHLGRLEQGLTLGGG
jgi:hypothetical protein